MFKEEREESQFEWSMLGDIEEGRPNLGPLVHVAVYRLMQFTLRDILIRDYGVEDADRIFFEAGKKAGEEYCKNMLTDKRDLDEPLRRSPAHHEGARHRDLPRRIGRLREGLFRSNCGRRPRLLGDSSLLRGDLHL